MSDFARELRDADNPQEIKVTQEINIQTGELRNRDPNWIEHDYYTIKKSKKYNGRREVKEEYYFMLLAEFQVSLKERYNASFEDMGRLLLLFTYTTYRNDQKKLYLKQANSRHYIDNKKLAEILKLTMEQTRQFKSRMKKKELLLNDEKGMYFTDDLIIRGELLPVEKRSHMNFYTVYDHPIRELYNIFAEQGNTKSVKPLGVLLCMIPFIKKLNKKEKSYDRVASNNMLVMSEWNDKADRYEPMSLTRLAEIIGISKKTLIKDIKSLNDFTKQETGEFLVYKYQSSMMPVGYRFKYTTEAIVINPYYTYSQDRATDSYYRLNKAIESLSGNSNVIDLNQYK